MDTIIEAAKLILEGLNEQHYCYQNDMAINKLEVRTAIGLRERTADRPSAEGWKEPAIKPTDPGYQTT